MQSALSLMLPEQQAGSADGPSNAEGKCEQGWKMGDLQKTIAEETKMQRRTANRAAHCRRRTGVERAASETHKCTPRLGQG